MAYILHKITDPDILLSFLSIHQDSSLFLINNILNGGLQDHNQRLQGTYLGAFEEGQLKGVLGHFWNGNIIVQAPEGIAALLEALPQHQYRSAAGELRPIKGILGPYDQLQQAMGIWNLPPEDIQMNSREVLFSLDLKALITPPDREGERVRHFYPQELPLLTRWKVHYNVEAQNMTDNEELWKNSEKLAKNQIKEKSGWVWEAQGQPVACSYFNAQTPEMVQIGGVWTPPEFRGKGYARRVVAASLASAKKQGVTKAILFTGEENIPALKAYRALGFQDIGHYGILLFKNPIRI